MYVEDLTRVKRVSIYMSFHKIAILSVNMLNLKLILLGRVDINFVKQNTQGVREGTKGN